MELKAKNNGGLGMGKQALSSKEMVFLISR